MVSPPQVEGGSFASVWGIHFSSPGRPALGSPQEQFEVLPAVSLANG